jgi:imidazolonepropionase-like amidohydrolase
MNRKLSVIVGGTIIDGNGGAPVREGVIVIDGERIISVGGSDTAIPADASRIDAKGKYVIPGLMDANVHLVYGFSTEYMLRFENQFEDIIREGAQIALKCGVTTVFDTWGPLDPLRMVREEINQRKLEGSRIFLAGNIVGLGGPLSADFYASTASVGKKTVQRINEMYEHGTGRELIYMAPEQVRVAIRRYLGNDLDFVKYAVSGHASSDTGFILFSPGVQRIIIDETRQRGLTIQTHTTSVESLRLAVEAGVDLMQHGDVTVREIIPDELVHKIADRKIPCTMVIYPQRYMRHVLGGTLSADPGSIADPRQQLQAVIMQNRRRLIEAGATILMATDGGVPYLDCPLLQEVFFQHPYPEILEDLVGFFGSGHFAWLKGATDAGLSPMGVLQAATRNVAAAYRKLDDLGTIESGKMADLVILNGNPLSDPANYAAINLVMKAGKVMNREALPSKRVLTAER